MSHGHSNIITRQIQDIVLTPGFKQLAIDTYHTSENAPMGGYSEEKSENPSGAKIQVGGFSEIPGNGGNIMQNVLWIG